MTGQDKLNLKPLSLKANNLKANNSFQQEVGFVAKVMGGYTGKIVNRFQCTLVGNL